MVRCAVHAEMVRCAVHADITVKGLYNTFNLQIFELLKIHRYEHKTQ
jgi:hypothetical protein